MAGPVVLATYKARAGLEETLVALIDRHVPLLRARGLATDHPSMVLTDGSGGFVEIFQWVDETAQQRAHADPEIGAMWDEMARVASLVAPSALRALGAPFPHLQPVGPSPR